MSKSIIITNKLGYEAYEYTHKNITFNVFMGSADIKHKKWYILCDEIENKISEREYNESYDTKAYAIKWAKIYIDIIKK